MAAGCALFALACGGLSVRHESTYSTGADATDGAVVQEPPQNQVASDTPAPDAAAMCVKVCARCMGVALGQSCDAFCSNVLSEAEAARCSGAFSSVLRCRVKAVDMCALDACPTQDNALTACVLDYCDSHSVADLCIGPI